MNHLLNIQNALISLFDTPVPENDAVGRAVLTRIFGKQDIDFDKPIIDISANPHLSSLVRAGVRPVVWESKENLKHEAGCRTVLDPIGTAGQESLLDLIGDFLFPPFVLVCQRMSCYVPVYQMTCFFIISYPYVRLGQVTFQYDLVYSCTY